MSNVKFSYDELNDVLYLRKEGIHASGSVMIGDFVLDLTKEKAGVEILNATDLLKCQKSKISEHTKKFAKRISGVPEKRSFSKDAQKHVGF